MRPRVAPRALALALLAVMVPADFAQAAAAVAHAPELAFAADHRSERNRFVRQGAVAAQLTLRAGLRPRLLVAFPAGDSGVALWLRTRNARVDWEVSSPPRPVTCTDTHGRPLRGIEVDIAARTTQQLVEPQQSAGRLEWTRDRIDGRPGYRLSIQVLAATHLDDSRTPSGRLDATGPGGWIPIGAFTLLHGGRGGSRGRYRRVRDIAQPRSRSVPVGCAPLRLHHD